MFGWLRRRRSAESAGPSSKSDTLFDEAFQARLEYLAIVSRRVAKGRTRAERRSQKTGSGIEFADHRAYSPGDDFRHLDWNVYGRTDRLLLRLFEEEEDLSVYIVLDASRSMGFGSPPKLDYAKRVAAALAYVALSNLDRVSLHAFSNALQARLAPTRGKSRIFKVFDFLRGVDADGETSLGAAMKTFVAQNQRRGVVILISDLYDPAGFEAGINALRFAQQETYVLHIVDPKDREPALRGDVHLVDAETGERRDVTITPKVLERFSLAHEGYQRRVAAFCTEKHVRYFTLDVGVPFDEAVLGLLRRGGMVR